MNEPRGYKEIWQHFFDLARDEGKDLVEAGRYADTALADHYAALADDAHDRAKERDL